MGILKFFKKAAAISERTIRVELINGADNSIIAMSDMLPAQLPDTFAINTTLDFKDQKWSVQSAERREQFPKALPGASTAISSFGESPTPREKSCASASLAFPNPTKWQGSARLWQR